MEDWFQCGFRFQAFSTEGEMDCNDSRFGMLPSKLISSQYVVVGFRSSVKTDCSALSAYDCCQGRMISSQYALWDFFVVEKHILNEVIKDF